MAFRFRALNIPAEPTEPLRVVHLEIAEPSWQEIDHFIHNELQYPGDVFLEFVRGEYLDGMRIGDYDPQIHIVMAVDEDGENNRRPINPRACAFYPSATHPIYGNALLVGEDHSDPYEGWTIVSLHDYVTPKSLVEYVRRIILPKHPAIKH